MTTQQILTVFSVLEVINLVALVILWLLPAPECKCRECVFHRDRDAVEKEKKRAQRHRDFHNGYTLGINYPWGDPRCPACKQGFDKDKDGR